MKKNICRDCVFNFGGFCERTCRDDLDEILECTDRIKEFDMSFYYDDTAGEYRVVAFMKDSCEIINHKVISKDHVLEMLERERNSVNKCIIDKIKES